MDRNLARGCTYWELNLSHFLGSNNAGVMARDCNRSCDGLELHFATNHIGTTIEIG